MTGLHGLHIIGGMVVMAYFIGPGAKMWKTNPEQFTNRIENTGLYWHFVDLVWIFLFPVSVFVVGLRAGRRARRLARGPRRTVENNMHSDAESVRKSIRSYLMVGAALFVFTAITVAVNQIHLAVPLAITVALDHRGAPRARWSRRCSCT